MEKSKNGSDFRVTSVTMRGKLSIIVEENEPSEQAIKDYNAKLNRLIAEGIECKSDVPA
ncbi:hypothetical protein MO973_09180 [Paenibacillus sp. TRM 82003]|nr:hypothetical protein [Paenibacillus sp. TRM 82003]